MSADRASRSIRRDPRPTPRIVAAAPAPGERLRAVRRGDRRRARPRRRPRAAQPACAPAAAATCCSRPRAPAAGASGPSRPLPRLPRRRLSPAQWDALQIPVSVAFFFVNSTLEQVAAFYPSPAGATESLLPLDTWDEVVAANPELATLHPGRRGVPRPRRRTATARRSASSCRSTPATSSSASCAGCGGASTAAPRRAARSTSSSTGVRARAGSGERASSFEVLGRPRRALRRAADAHASSCGSPSRSGQPVHAVALQCQIRIEPQRRRYEPTRRTRLVELFGETRAVGRDAAAVPVDPRRHHRHRLHRRRPRSTCRALHLRLRGRRHQVPPRRSTTARSRSCCCSPGTAFAREATARRER